MEFKSPGVYYGRKTLRTVFKPPSDGGQSGGSAIIEWPTNISSYTFDGGTYTIPFGSDYRSISWGLGGARFFVSDSGTDRIRQFTTLAEFDVVDATYNSINYSLGNQDANALGGHAFSADGTRLILASIGNGRLYQYNLLEPFNIGTLSYTGNFLSVISDLQPSTLCFSEDGFKMFVCGSFPSQKVVQYDLINKFDVTGATVSYVLTSLSWDEVHGITFNNDGSILYITHPNSGEVREIALTEKYTLSSAIDNGIILNISNEVQLLRDIIFSQDGSRFFAVDGFSNLIKRFSL